MTLSPYRFIHRGALVFYHRGCDRPPARVEVVKTDGPVALIRDVDSGIVQSVHVEDLAPAS